MTTRGAHRGEAHHSAKLTRDDVLAIRRNAPHESQRALAATFGVSSRAIHKIIHRQTWRHLP